MQKPQSQNQTQQNQPQQSAGKPDIQGEGDYRSAKRFDEAEQAFVKSGKVEEAARDAAPKNDQEARQMKSAEREGKSHSKGEDPAITDPKRHKPADPQAH